MTKEKVTAALKQVLWKFKCKTKKMKGFDGHNAQISRKNVFDKNHRKGKNVKDVLLIREHILYVNIANTQSLLKHDKNENAILYI